MLSFKFILRYATIISNHERERLSSFHVVARKRLVRAPAASRGRSSGFPTESVPAPPVPTESVPASPAPAKAGEPRPSGLAACTGGPKVTYYGI